MILTFKFEPDSVKTNKRRPTRYLEHMSFGLKAIVRTHTHTHTGCSTRTTKVVGNG